MNERTQRQPPVPPPAVALTFDLIALAQVGDREEFSARLETVKNALELSATLDFVRFYRQADFAQLIESHCEKLQLEKLPKAEGEAKGGKRL